MQQNQIDIERLREDLKQECLGAYFVGGFGGALMENLSLEKASREELLEIAQKRGIDIYKYQLLI